MDRVCFIGDLWSAALVDIVLGTSDRPNDAEGTHCTGVAAKRALYFAHVLDLRQTSTDTTIEISFPKNLDTEVLMHAATEVMGYYQKIRADALSGRRQMSRSRAAARAAAKHAPAPRTLRSSLSRDRVEISQDIATHEGFFLTRTYSLRHPWFDGGHSETITREVFQATDAALVLPYDAKRDRVLLVEQFRMGPMGREDPFPWVLEPVAGRIDAGETPQDAAYRECLEETDLTLKSLEHISSHYCSPGCSTEYFHCYLGLADLPELDKRTGGLATENEDIRRHVIAFDDAMSLMQSGEVNIGPLYLMLLWLERERPRLRALA